MKLKKKKIIKKQTIHRFNAIKVGYLGYKTAELQEHVEAFFHSDYFSMVLAVVESQHPNVKREDVHEVGYCGICHTELKFHKRYQLNHYAWDSTLRHFISHQIRPPKGFMDIIVKYFAGTFGSVM